LAERSQFFSTTGVGDGPGGGYSAANMIEMFRTSQIVDETGTCILKGKLNELAVTGTSSPVSVASGVAWVYGAWYQNDAATTVAVATPVTNPRIDRIILRYGSAAQTVRVVRLAGTEAVSPTAPALTQNSTTYEISLAQVRITTGGVITVTDERGFITDPGAAGAVDNATIDFDSTTKKIRVMPTGSPTVAGLTVSRSLSGGTTQEIIRNTSNTASSAAQLQISTAGASGDDPYINFNISGVSDWTVGLDNSDSDQFKITAGATLGSTDIITATSAGNVTIAGANTTTTKSSSGGTVTTTTANTSNTAGSNARELIQVAGSTANDAFTQYQVSGSTDWSVGIDNSDSDKFKISASSALGTSDEVVVDTSGNMTVTGNVSAPNVTASSAITGATGSFSGNVTSSAGSFSGAGMAASASSSGGNVIVSATNTSNTANSNAQLKASVAGASANDPFILYDISGVQNWAEGVDNSDSDKFKVSASSALGTNDRLIIDTSGNTTVGGSLTAGTSVTATNGLTVSAGSVSLPALSVAGAAIAADSIDDTKAGDRMPQFYRRQGGSATDWNVANTNNYTPTGGIRMQAGVYSFSTVLTVSAGSGFSGVTATATFPQAYSAKPWCIIGCVPIGGLGASQVVAAYPLTITTTTVQFLVYIYNGSSGTATFTADIQWLAIGPE